MLKQTALISWASGDAATRAEIVRALGAQAGVQRALIEPVLPVSAFGGDCVWHAHFADLDAWRGAGGFALLDRLAENPAVSGIDAVIYVPDLRQLGDPAITDCVYRTLLVSVEPGTAANRQDQWLAELRAMPDYIPEIVNAATGVVIESRGARAWSHVWEQEFRAVGDLTGAYMASPYHWGHVDRWFDPEHPDRIIDLRLCHSASTLPASVIADYVPR